MLDAIAKKKIKSYLLDYLKLRIPNFVQSSKNGLFTCPCCEKHPDKPISANIYPPNSGIVHCFDPSCGKIGDIFDICRKIDFSGQDLKDEDIADLLCEELNITLDKEVLEWFEKYASWGWSLVPVSPNKNGFKGKEANIEKEWEKKEHKNVQEWIEWRNAELNFGLHAGKISNSTLIDIDTKEIPLELQRFVGETLTQTTKKGFHFCYFYEPELPSIDLRDTPCALPVEIRNSSGWQTVIFPSIVEGHERTWNNKAPIKMPDELKVWLLSKCVIKEEPKEILASSTEDLKDFSFNVPEGKRSNTITSLGGYFRKQLNVEQTNFVLDFLNSKMPEPLSQKELKATLSQLKKYSSADYNLLTKQIVEYLTKHTEASARDLQDVLKAEKKDIMEAISNLLLNGSIYKQRSLYKIVERPNWKQSFLSESKVLDFEVPYFNNIATFRNSDLCTLGASTGVGKSFIALNIIKKLVDQGIHPYYISSEPGNRFANISTRLGLREGQFSFVNHYNPQQLTLEPNSVSIIDWLLPESYAEVDKLYKIFSQMLDKSGGLLFIFSQLRENGTFYSEAMVQFFSAFSVKYFYTKSGNVIDNVNTYFETTKVREPKTGQQINKIPMKFDNPFLELRKNT